MAAPAEALIVAMASLRDLALAAIAAIVPGPPGTGDGLVGGLRALEADLSAKQMEERAAELALLPGSIDAWLDVRAADALPPPGGDGEPEPLTAAQHELLARIAPRFAREELLLLVADRMASKPEPAWRGAALDLLRGHGSSAELELLVELVRGPDGKLPSEGPLVDAFQEAMVAIIHRDARIYGRLGWVSENAGALYPSVARALGLSGDLEALPYLAGMLEQRGVSRVALQEIGRLAPRAPRAARAGLAERVRPFLGATDKPTLGHAIRALVLLHDEKAVPELIALVANDAFSARAAAFAALRDLTRTRLPDEAARWKAWYEAERAWIDQKSTAALDSLGVADEARVVAAIREISGHGLERDRLAEGIVRVLREHPTPAVRAQACIGLGRLGSREGVAILAQALTDPDPGVGGHALQALRSITGLDLPWDAAAWKKALANEE